MKVLGKLEVSWLMSNKFELLQTAFTLRLPKVDHIVDPRLRILNLHFDLNDYIQVALYICIFCSVLLLDMLSSSRTHNHDIHQHRDSE